MNRVVITGMGIYSCLGYNLDDVKNSLYTGKSGIGLEPIRKELGFRSALTALVEKPILKGLLPRRQRVGLPVHGEYAYLSTVEALKKAGVDQDWLNANEVGIIFGNDSCAEPTIRSVDTLREKGDTALIGSGAVFQAMNSTVSMNLSTIFQLTGINYTVSAACASGSHAIGMGYHMIKSGMQDMIVCGGAQEVNYHSMGSFDALQAFSIREDAPTKASRPFDRDRDGLIPSGGAATVVLESYDSAVKRGANILGEVVGYGFSSNGGHISQPTVEGPVRSLEKCLKDAGLLAKDIDYISAHATSTPVGDMCEAKALYEVFGEAKTLISSTKGMTGHECWMAGASEIVYSLLMMHNDFVAPNINLENPDEDAAKLNIAASTKEHKIDTFLSNSFGFGGTNSSLIIKKVQ